jgi:hypothetical protein
MNRPAPSEDIWQLSEASVLGKSHANGNLPNQDAVAVITNAAGDVLCAVVSDGAGTATRSATGSRIAADTIANQMCLFGKKYQEQLPKIDSVQAALKRSIELVRKGLESQGYNLRDCHCTMVLWLSMPLGSFVAQIGDSAALRTRFEWREEENPRSVDFFPEGNYDLFEVDRGEYSNETHFLTEDDWEAHLRIYQLPAHVDAMVLMTDGAMDIAMLRGKPFKGFLSNLVGKLLALPDRASRNQIIHEWLDNPQTYGVTGDDKTLFVAVRQRCRKFSGVPVFVGKPATQATQATALPPTQTSSLVLRALEAGEQASKARFTATPTSPPKLPTHKPAAKFSVLTQYKSPVVLTLIGMLCALSIALITLAYVHLKSKPSVPDLQEAIVSDHSKKLNAQREATPQPVVVADTQNSAHAEPHPANGTVNSQSDTQASGGTPPQPAQIQQGSNLGLKETTRKPTESILEVPTRPAVVYRGIAEAKLSWRSGPPLVIRVITFPTELSPIKDYYNNCAVGMFLDASHRNCIVAVDAAGIEPGKYAVSVEFEVPAGQPKKVEAIVFEVPASKQSGAPAAPKSTPKK